MFEIGVCGIDLLFKIAGGSISGWLPDWKAGDITCRPTFTTWQEPEEALQVIRP